MIQALKFWLVTILVVCLFFGIQQIIGSPTMSILFVLVILSGVLIGFLVVRAAIHSRAVMAGLLLLGLLIYASYAGAGTIECRRTSSTTQDCSSFNEKKQRTGKFICRTHKSQTTCTKLW